MTNRNRAHAEGILYTDMYQLTMAHLYFRMGLHQKQAQFDHFFRSYPDYGAHQAGYCINAGMAWLLEWMQTAHFGDDDVEFLRAQTGQTGERLFADDFLTWLRREGNFDAITMRAIPEGRVVHPNVSITAVQGPMAMAQILETPLLNMLNYPTLIATRAARISQAARGKLLLEFGMRRGQERAVTAGTRAAFIGGADYTSNTGASRILGFPPKGTHSHSMVQLFMALGEGELGAFRAYADVYPDDCILLIDTINTLESGLPNAIKVFDELRRRGHQPVGVRLDSGDLAYLAVQAAKTLNAAGYPDVGIVLSNQLDEITIMQILAQISVEARQLGMDADAIIDRLTYGVGTNLITSAGDAALDGVYKLVAVHNEEQEWTPAIKISENPVKVPNPGHKRVWRIYGADNLAMADYLTLNGEDAHEMEPVTLLHPTDTHVSRILPQAAISEIEPLLQTVWQDGKPLYTPPLSTIRAQRQADIDRLHPGVKRLINPHIYHVSLSPQLRQLKQTLIQSYKST